MTDDTTFDLWRLAAYAEGTCPPHETAEVEAWIASHAGRAQLVADLRAAREALVRAGRAETAPAALEPIYAAVLAKVTAAPSEPRRRAARARMTTFRGWLAGGAGGTHPTFSGLAGRVVAALLDRGETELTEAEAERLRRLIQRSKQEGE